MFFTRMVSGFICSKNSNKNANNNHQQQQPQSQQSAKSPKPNKKVEKPKRPSLSKADSKKSISDLLKTQIKEPQNKDVPSTSKATTFKQPTKVKSGSWKRSEKQISSYNTISGKKSKSLRKRSPTWLKFPNSPVKIAEKVSYVSPADSTSVCRPGTLYSDVLFGAGSSCLVKIKTLTPRRNSSNTAQKKLTKALLKCTGNENDGSGSEAETDCDLFPSLNDNKSPAPAEVAKNAVTIPPDGSTIVKNDDEPVVVVRMETNGVRNAENGFNDIPYGNYLAQHFKQLTGTTHSVQKPTTKLFTIDIPQWNFLDVDVSSDAYPKFLCQFEDEHYLKAEKMALLGLKLALGNNSQQGKFKF